MLWPLEETIATVSRMIVPPAEAMLARAPPIAWPVVEAAPLRLPRAAHHATFVQGEMPIVADRAADPVRETPQPVAPTIVAPFLPIPIASSPSRFAASAWMIARQGQGGSNTGGQLGGSQIGVRGTFVLDRAHRLALSARLSAPLTGPGREAAIGVDWQPLPAPIHVIAERRIALDGGRGGTALLVIGGIGPQLLAPGVRVEAYGQAGVIVREGLERFADGAARVSHDLGEFGGVRVDAGAGMWGGAQRGAARLDIGPSLGARLPITGQAIRLTIDWRHRIAGSARPGSGPALSIGSDF